MTRENKRKKRKKKKDPELESEYDRQHHRRATRLRSLPLSSSTSIASAESRLSACCCCELTLDVLVRLLLNPGPKGRPFPVADRFDMWCADEGSADAPPPIEVGGVAASIIIIMACRLFAPAETESAPSGMPLGVDI